MHITIYTVCIIRHQFIHSAARADLRQQRSQSREYKHNFQHLLFFHLISFHFVSSFILFKQFKILYRSHRQCKFMPYLCYALGFNTDLFTPSLCFSLRFWIRNYDSDCDSGWDIASLQHLGAIFIASLLTGVFMGAGRKQVHPDETLSNMGGVCRTARGSGSKLKPEAARGRHFFLHRYVTVRKKETPDTCVEALRFTNCMSCNLFVCKL